MTDTDSTMPESSPALLILASRLARVPILIETSAPGVRPVAAG
ncbi:hypothetical protein U1872_18830 [Sphingomonas sp. RB3P16]